MNRRSNRGANIASSIIALRLVHRPVPGQVGVNRLLARWRHFFNWAIGEGYLEQSPFKRAHVSVIELNRAAETPRDRRLIGDHDRAGEEARLLKAAEAYPHVHALIVAARDTGCRRGELLSLQWRHVDLARAAITLINAQTKTSRTRTIPIMSDRLLQLLKHRRTGPDGTEHGPDASVFGNEVGEPILDIKTEWKAVCTAANITGLVLHDLRHEFGSRLLESERNPAVVRDWLGHANITTTSRYVATTAAVSPTPRNGCRRHGKLRHGRPRNRPLGTPLLHRICTNPPLSPLRRVA